MFYVIKLNCTILYIGIVGIMFIFTGSGGSTGCQSPGVIRQHIIRFCAIYCTPGIEPSSAGVGHFLTQKYGGLIRAFCKISNK